MANKHVTNPTQQQLILYRKIKEQADTMLTDYLKAVRAYAVQRYNLALYQQEEANCSPYIRSIANKIANESLLSFIKKLLAKANEKFDKRLEIFTTMLLPYPIGEIIAEGNTLVISTPYHWITIKAKLLKGRRMPCIHWQLSVGKKDYGLISCLKNSTL